MAYTGTFIFKSTDAGAPVLEGRIYSTNANGTLVYLLKKCLVDGYNSQASCSATRSGTTATIAKTTHGFLAGQVVRISGFSETNFNGDFKIATATANDFTITVANTGAASEGANGTTIMCPLDWVEHGSNSDSHRAFQQPNDVGITNQCWYSFYDGTTQHVRFKGFTGTLSALTSTLPDTDGGTAFPTTAQFSGGLHISRSSSNDSTARAWTIVSDRRTIHVMLKASGATTVHAFSIGQIVSYKSTTDSWNAMIMGNNDIVNNGGYNAWLLNTTTTWPSATAHGLWFSGAYSSGAGTSTPGNKPVLTGATNGGTQPGATASLTYPAPVAGGLMLQRMVLAESVAVGPDLRGHSPGMWFPWHQRPLTEDTTFTGATGSSIAGRTFYVAQGPNNGQVFIELRDGSYWD